ncbi:putative hydrolase [Streptomyces sp. NBRC 110611]|uniref:alpha/beta fold hydrolase n=1 Tax=Streptomyces sp. NBRC 110611 TaxID=1621259 RepID=UPI00082AB1A8|nr:alpha/beta hydrolase [Streptomyces sp. NBRC 110611]GAU71066.1 putative hydrolase [Streptomyces sp. NBRC 110611]
MDSIYRSETGKELIRRWCLDQLAAWPVPHERKTVTVKGAETHVVLAGSGATTVVFVPGTNFNAAASLPLATALVAAGFRVLLVDIPGQPGLSCGERPLSGRRLSWYGAWLSGVIEEISSAPVAVMGHSFGAPAERQALPSCPRGRFPAGSSPGSTTSSSLHGGSARQYATHSALSWVWSAGPGTSWSKNAPATCPPCWTVLPSLARACPMGRRAHADPSDRP